MVDLSPDEAAHAACVTAEYTEMVECGDGRWFDAVGWACYGLGLTAGDN